MYIYKGAPICIYVHTLLHTGEHSIPSIEYAESSVIESMQEAAANRRKDEESKKKAVDDSELAVVREEIASVAQAKDYTVAIHVYMYMYMNGPFPIKTNNQIQTNKYTNK